MWLLERFETGQASPRTFLIDWSLSGPSWLYSYLSVWSFHTLTCAYLEFVQYMRVSEMLDSRKEERKGFDLVLEHKEGDGLELLFYDGTCTSERKRPFEEEEEAT